MVEVNVGAVHYIHIAHVGSAPCETAPICTVLRARRITFFLVNRVENQNEPKRPQGGGHLGSFWFSTRPTALGGTDYNLHHARKALKCSDWSEDFTEKV